MTPGLPGGPRYLVGEAPAVGADQTCDVLTSGGRWASAKGAQPGADPVTNRVHERAVQVEQHGGRSGESGHRYPFPGASKRIRSTLLSNDRQ